MRYLKKFPASLFELKDIRSLAAVAMLLALRIVLGMFANATLPMFGNTVKFSAAFIPIAVAGAMFGPIPAGLVGALGDVLSFLIAPTGGAYFPGFTISGLLTGLIYGFALYNEKLSLPRIAIAWAVNALVVESFMAAYWLYILSGAELPVLSLRARNQSGGQMRTRDSHTIRPRQASQGAVVQRHKEKGITYSESASVRERFLFAKKTKTGSKRCLSDY